MESSGAYSQVRGTELQPNCAILRLAHRKTEGSSFAVSNTLLDSGPHDGSEERSCASFPLANKREIKRIELNKKKGKGLG